MDGRNGRADGLISYGPDLPELYRRAAVYADAILKGASPADLRVKQPDVLKLFINLKTTRKLGLAIQKYLLYGQMR